MRGRARREQARPSRLPRLRKPEVIEKSLVEQADGIRRRTSRPTRLPDPPKHTPNVKALGAPIE
jgi:hypothetical protein